ncbi:tRNA pseudouridine(38-40) synthase TruA [Planctomycetes bacterium Pan216]
MRTLKLVLAYDGTGYCGWQVQPNGPTIQEELGRAIEKITGTRTLPVACSRTDSGVHALAQVAHLRTETTLEPSVLKRALNAELPEQIRVVSVDEVGDDFHAVHAAKWKLYRYVFHDGAIPDVFLRHYCWRIPYRLDVEAMNRAAKALEGTHDFRCFETEWPNRATSVRTIRRCMLTRLGDCISLDVEGDGFLYNMVRAIAGSLHEVGRGKWPIGRIAEIVERGERAQAGPTAPAKGLFLTHVELAADMARD